MKREELDRLREKYFAGNTSLEEERQLKESAGEEFFSVLKSSEENMEWDFESFMEKTEVLEEDKEGKEIPLKRRIILLTSIAASLVLGFFFVKQWTDQDNSDVVPSQIAYQSEERILNEDQHSSQSIKQKITIDSGEEKIEEPIHRVAVKRSPKKMRTIQAVNTEENEIYVEINGVRIYDEEKALEVTETALHLAASNLKKGMEGVENIKYLNIEI